LVRQEALTPVIFMGKRKRLQKEEKPC